MDLNYYIKVFEDYVSECELLPKNAYIYVLVSGGKDSMAMSSLFKGYAKKRKDLKLEYLNVVFPQMVFGKDKKDINATVQNISKGLKNFKSEAADTNYTKLGMVQYPCLLCKEVRRKIIADIIAKEKKNKIIIATAHNNYDLLAYFVEFFGINPKDLAEQGLNYEQLQKISLKDEQMEHFSHFFPKTELKSGVALIKPMLVFSRPEIEEILKKTGIPAYLEPCPYAKERPKRVLFKFLSTFPAGQIKNLTKRDTFKEMLSVLKEKAGNYDEALEKVKKTNYKELLF
jgi:tRNA(Ile)-lysidine synthase TilS/MesJ